MVLRVHFNARIREFYTNHDDVDEIENDSFYCIGRLGYDMLKPEKEAALLSFLGVFVSLPTGYGKSLCYAALPVTGILVLKILVRDQNFQSMNLKKWSPSENFGPGWAELFQLMIFGAESQPQTSNQEL